MKNLLLVILLLFSINIYADEKSCEELKKENLTAEQLSRRGCCSHHSGVCNCSGGRVVCCDGSYSPSCTCNKEDNNNVIYSNEESTKG